MAFTQFLRIRFGEAWKVAIIVFVVSRVLYACWSLIILHFWPIAFAQPNLFDEPLLTAFDTRTNERYVYSRVVNGETRNFALSDGELRDESGTIWSLSCGCAIGGRDVGKVLVTNSYMPEDIFPYKDVLPYRVAWLAMWQRFDANWYSSIALYGYRHSSGDIHFPPLFPALIHVLLPLVRHPFLGGLVLSHIFTLIMLVVLYDFIQKQFDKSIAARTLVYLMVFPSAFFFYSAYTESLFVLLVLLFFNALNAKSWHSAGLLAFMAVLTRLQGVILFLPLLYTIYRSRASLSLKDVSFGFGLPTISVLIYLLIRWSADNSAILPISEENLHARQVFPWENYWYGLQVAFSGRPTLVDLLNLIFTSLFAVLVFMAWKKMPFSLNLYSVASLLVFTSRLVETQPLNSMIRYVITLFPCFVLLAIYGKENSIAHRIIIYTGFLLSMYLSAQFWLWGWVA
jgi:hypothetical protein